MNNIKDSLMANTIFFSQGIRAEFLRLENIFSFDLVAHFVRNFISRLRISLSGNAAHIPIPLAELNIAYRSVSQGYRFRRKPDRLCRGN